jgi:ATP-dependent Lon protease
MARVPNALVANVTAEFAKYEQARLAGRQHTPLRPELARDPVRLSYQIAASLHIHPRESQQLLELDQVAGRLEQELELLKRENRPAPKTIGPFSMN